MTQSDVGTIILIIILIIILVAGAVVMGAIVSAISIRRLSKVAKRRLISRKIFHSWLWGLTAVLVVVLSFMIPFMVFLGMVGDWIIWSTTMSYLVVLLSAWVPGLVALFLRISWSRFKPKLPPPLPRSES